MIPFESFETKGTIGARFERVAAAIPEALAISHGSQNWSYRDVLEASEAYRSGFARLDRQRPVALVFDHGAEAIIAMMGALRAGVPILLVDPVVPPVGVADCLADCQLVVTEQANAGWCVQQAGPVPVVVEATGLAAIASGANTKETDVNLDSLGIIYLTSGSTGRAKGVLRTQRALMRPIIKLVPTFGFGPGTRISHLTSFAFAGSTPAIFGGLLSGSAIDIFDLRKMDATNFAKTIRSRNITVMLLNPALLRELVEILSVNPGGWEPQLIIVGADKLRPEDINSLRDRLGWTCPIVNRLASSEVGIIAEWVISSDRLDPDLTVPVGYAKDYCEIEIIDETGACLPPGEIGEIVVYSEFLASGYWQQPDLTAEKFSAAPLPDAPNRRRLITGDMGRLQEDGLLDFLGRKDNMVKIRGYRVEMDAIENALRKLEGVAEAVVVVRPDARDADHLVGYVQKMPGAAIIGFDLRKDLLRNLPNFMVPRRIIVLDHFPLSSGGKILRGALPSADRSRPDGLPDLVPPRGTTEKLLAEIWKEILELDDISREDDFFDLGGDSLNLMQVASTLQLQLNFTFPETDLFLAASLNGMAKTIETFHAQADCEHEIGDAK